MALKGALRKEAKKRAYLYARFSSDSQREVSIDDQFKAGEAFCKANGYEIAGYYSDHALTGRNDKRPDFQRMMREIEGCDVVVIWNTDRLHRNMFNAFKYLGELIDAGVDFASVTQPELNGESEVRLLLYSIYTWKDQRYSEDLSANVSRGMRSKAERGEYLGYKKFGYTHEGNRIVIDEEEAAWVSRAHAMWQNNETIAYIADVMGKAGIRTSRGSYPGYNFVKAILTDESYTGVYIWGDIRKEDAIPAIITRACYEDSQRRFVFRPRKKEAHDYLLSGRLICGDCHNYMHGEKAKGGKVVYYCCKNKRKACRGNVRAEELEALVVKSMRDVFCDYDTCKRVVDFILKVQEAQAPRTDLDGYRKQLKDVSRKRKRVVDAIAEGLPMSDAKAKLDELTRLEETINVRIEEAQKVSMILEADELFEMLDAVRSGEFTDEEIIETFVSEVYLYNDSIVIVTNLDEGHTDPMEVYAAFENENTRTPKGTGELSLVDHRQNLRLRRGNRPPWRHMAEPEDELDARFLQELRHVRRAHSARRAALLRV